MKRGDKIYCKKLLPIYNYIFSEDRLYYVHSTDIDCKEIYISNIKPTSENYMKNIGIWFNLGEKNTKYTYNFKEYFYNVQELRKLKLEKLNENKK